MTYLTDVGREMNYTTTENDAKTLRSSGNALVDFFALGGSTRGNPSLGLDLFLKAFAQDQLSAIRILFYLRDIHGGQGERQLFRNALTYLAYQEPNVAQKIAEYVPEYGRFDDLFVLQTEMLLPIVQKQLDVDKNSNTPSLLGKWMPSANTSSRRTRTLAHGMIKALGLTERQYRKLLSALRAKIKLVEQQLSRKQFDAIEYDKLPSQASLKYRKAFDRNDHKRYSAYLAAVTKGEKKINTATLYPYQVYDAMGTPGAEQLWANLPDYTNGKNAIVVADVSGSMAGRPMSIAVSLALYFAERNVGQFKDHFITFSGNPLLQKIMGATLRDRMNSIETSDWEGNTNLYRVFKLLVDTAVKTQAKPEEMPSVVYVISDMEFDQCEADQTNFETIDALYADTPYKRPHLVFWQVDTRQKQVPVSSAQEHVTMVSGASASAFKMAVEGRTPEELMMKVISQERYAQIVL